MKILDAGHKYMIDSLDNGCKQIIQFVKREGPNFPFNAHSYGGTNCQEVLRVLIDRSEYLNKQKPCAETEAIIGCLQSALLLFELRAARRHGRYLELMRLSLLSSEIVCDKCKHIGCEGNLCKPTTDVSTTSSE